MHLTPDTKSWVEPDERGEFSIHNLPFGCFSDESSPSTRVGVRIGNYVLNMYELGKSSSEGVFPKLSGTVKDFGCSTLNSFAALGRAHHREVRAELQSLLVENSEHGSAMQQDEQLYRRVFIPVEKVTMHLPMQIGDYTDFYAGYHHAYSLGVMFRGPENALQPNYLHLPVGYHGRSSSIVVSGTPIRRPVGQILDESKSPVTGASRKLDIELELGCFVSRPSTMGECIDVNNAEEYIFGYVLLNDWSARDIQSWEYVPLGPFNGKNFGSTVSPWVVLADALEPFRTKGIDNPKQPLQNYLQEKQESRAFDIGLQVDIAGKTPTSGEDPRELTQVFSIAQGKKYTTLSRTSSKNLIWSFPQMIAHHTLGGCPMRTGDFFGSGTISGTESSERGSFIEMSEAGKVDIDISEGETRRFLEDGDSIVLRGVCEKDGRRIGFGECEGVILPARAIS